MKKIKIFALVLAIVMCIALLASCSKPVIAMEYKGENITMNMYSYWLSQIKSQYVSEANDTDEYWATKYSNGETYEQKMREIVDFNVKVNLVCMHLFNELGLKVSESEANELKTGLSDLLKSYGSASELNSFLSQYNINYNMLGEIYEIELKTSLVYDALYKEGGKRAITDEVLEKYFTDNYSRLDMIMIYNSVVYETDEDGKILFDETTGNPKTKELSEDEKKAKNDLAADIMTRLENGEDFDALKAQYNEDPNKDVYTDGYYVSSNDVSVYGTEIVVAAQNMEIDEVRKIEDSSIICIMKRKEMDSKAYKNENYADQLGNLLNYCQNNDFNTYMSELIKDVVVYSEETNKISIKNAALFG